MTTTLSPAPTPTPIPAHNVTATTRSVTDTLRGVPNALRSDWIKVTSIRSNHAILGLTLVVSGFISWAVGRFVTEATPTVMDTFTFSTVFTAVFAAVAGILIFSSEAQHGTLAPVLTAQPARSVLALSKTVTAAGMGAAIGVAGLVAGFVGAYLSGIDVGDTSNLLSTSAWAVGFASISSMLGLGVGMIARHSTAAISGLLVWWLVVENLVNVFLAERFARFLPFTAGNGMLGVSTGPGSEGVAEAGLTTVENALVFGGYAAAAVVIGTVLLHRRDSN